MNSGWIDNSIPEDSRDGVFMKYIAPLLMIAIGIFAYFFIATHNRWLPLVITGAIALAHFVIVSKKYDWHFDKIRFDEDGIHLRRTSPKIRFLPREAFIPWEHVYSISVYPSGHAEVISWPWIFAFKGDFWIVKDTVPEALEYFYKYGKKKNPKIKIYGA